MPDIFTIKPTSPTHESVITIGIPGTGNDVTYIGSLNNTGTLNINEVLGQQIYSTIGQVSNLSGVATRQSIQLIAFGPTGSITVGDGKAYYRVPDIFNNYIITGVHAQIITAGLTGANIIQVARIRGGSPVDVLSTKLSVDSNETSSSTAATGAVINSSNRDLLTDDLIRIDVDNVSAQAAQGLNVTIGILL